MDTVDEIEGKVKEALTTIEHERDLLNRFHETLGQKLVVRERKEKRGIIKRTEREVDVINSDFLPVLRYTMEFLQSEHVKMRNKLVGLREYIQENNAYLVGEFIINKRLAGILSRNIRRFQEDESLYVKSILRELGTVEEFTEDVDLAAYRDKLHELEQSYGDIAISTVAEVDRNVDPIAARIEWSYMLEETGKLKSFVDSIAAAHVLLGQIDFLEARSRSYEAWCKLQPKYRKIVESLKVRIETGIEPIEKEQLTHEQAERLRNIEDYIGREVLPQLTKIRSGAFK